MRTVNGFKMSGKVFASLSLTLCAAGVLFGCSTNPATGKSQFTALMSPSQENKIGASEHTKIIAEQGAYDNQKIQSYVNEIGQKLAKNTERKDVQYKFFVIDSPVVNAFALPGGYVYISRGILALANNEAELASVVGHEIGHITARHSAERYSQAGAAGILSTVASIAIGSSGVSQALGLGSNLYLSSYSRGQENESDSLGIRYLDRAGYNPKSTSAFLQNLQNSTALDARINDKKNSTLGYFATHPATSDRVSKTVQEAKSYPQHDVFFRDKYLNMINGMVYGDSDKQGFVRDDHFIHPKLGFKFAVPDGFRVVNQPSQVFMAHKSGAAMVFDLKANKAQKSPMNYIREDWLDAEAKVVDSGTMRVNGMQGASVAFEGQVNNRAMTIRLIAIEWKPGQIVRFQVAIPSGASKPIVDSLKRASYSFANLTAKERVKYKPYRLHVFTAGSGDSVAKRAAALPYKDHQDSRFRVLNSLASGQELQAGKRYKTVGR
jgi:predicted Zn-dependent protease